VRCVDAKSGQIRAPRLRLDAVHCRAHESNGRRLLRLTIADDLVQTALAMMEARLNELSPWQNTSHVYGLLQSPRMLAGGRFPTLRCACATDIDLPPPDERVTVLVDVTHVRLLSSDVLTHSLRVVEVKRGTGSPGPPR
jgi:hypothetical protein